MPKYIKWDLEKAKKYVKSLGSELKTDKWNGTHARYYFKCPQCGNWKFTTFHNIQNGYLLCVHCANKKNGLITKYCSECGKKFNTYKSTQKYCSTKCAHKASEKVVDKNILIDLYISKRIPAYKIAAMFETSKSVILRRLKKLNIVRTSQESKHEETFKFPSKKELKDLYLDKFLSYDKISEIYNVDKTLISLWLKKYSIPIRKANETRLGKDFKEPTKAELIDLYINKGLNTHDIGRVYNVGDQTIARRLRKFDIPVNSNSFGNEFYLHNGIKVKSSYEKILGDMLYNHSIKFIYEPQLPFNHHYHGDFLIKNLYIEIWGVEGNSNYNSRKLKKIKLYKSNGLKLLSLYPKDFINIDYTKLKNKITPR